MSCSQLADSLVEAFKQQAFLNDWDCSWIHVSLQRDTAFYRFFLFKINSFYFLVRHTEKIRNLTNRGLLNIDNFSFQNVVNRRPGQTT
ncbi:hypothetical protein D3C76_1157990 [compost metagenome]